MNVGVSGIVPPIRIHFASALDAISAHAARVPDAIALVHRGRELSYGELERRSTAIARMLLEKGIERGSRVGLEVGRSPEMVVGALGILKSGAAYVPIDPAYPEERIRMILDAAEIGAMVRAEPSEADRPDVPVVRIDGSGEDAPDIELPRIEPSDVAYVMYTSGSSGRPKGVQITHGNLAGYVASLGEAIGVHGSDRYLHTASIAFSSSVRQMVLPLAHGAAIEIADRELIGDPLALFEQIGSSGVTVIDLVPSYARLCIDEFSRLEAPRRGRLLDNSLRLILSASEPLPAEIPRTWSRWLGDRVRLINMYGQTETTGICFVHPIDPSALADGGVTPLGKPVEGMTAYLLDDDGHPVALGEVGNIHVAGSGIGAGYLGEPELTADAFRPDPFSAQSRRMYRTGDRGRLRRDGTMEFVGRSDRQVKIRGFRVELEEVEAALRADPTIVEGVVGIRPDEFGGNRLVAYIVNDGGEAAVKPLLNRLREKLAHYMVPAEVFVLDELPRLPNGKVAHRTLPDLTPQTAVGSAEYEAPDTETERTLAAIWSDFFADRRIGRHEDFFDLGGDSLLAMRVGSRIRDGLGIELPHDALFRYPTISALAREIDGAKVDGAAAVDPVATVETGALSFAQERLWVLHQMQPDAVAYHLTATARLSGPLNGPALSRALTELVRHHPALRTAFPSASGGAVQEVLPPGRVPLPVVDLGFFEAEERDAEALRVATEEARRPFDLARGPLFRAMLLRFSEQDHLLVLVYHHIIADGWSRGVLLRDLSRLYDAFAAGREPVLAEPASTAAEYAAVQRSRFEEVPAESLEFWREYLGERPPVLELPTDRPRPPMQSFRGATRSFELSAELIRRLRGLGRTENATLFMTLLAGLNALLHRYSGQREILIGSPIASRNRTELEDVVGFFVNTIPIRAEVEDEQTFHQLLASVRDSTLDAYRHQEIPFERVVDSLQIPRDLSRSPVFQVMFVLQKELQALKLEGLRCQTAELDVGAAKFDLTFSLAPSEGGMRGTVEYSTDLFEADTIDRMMGHFVTILEGIADAPDTPVAHLPLLSGDERTRMLVEWNDTATEEPIAHCLHDLIVEQVHRTPDNIAISFEGRELTYRELDEQSNRVARQLRSMGVAPDKLVGVFMERSAELVIGLVGIHKAGGAYVPLDPGFPADRISYMVEDAAVEVILTQTSLAQTLPEHDAELLILDADLAAVADQSSEPVASGATPENLAYVIYTSGSTGRPKGVMVQHRNVSNFFAGMDQRIGADPGSWLAVTSISFDISVLELFWTLSRGFKVVVQGDSLLGDGEAPSEFQQKPIDFSLFYFSGSSEEPGRDTYRLLLEGARFADENGFEAVWTPERHFHEFGGIYPNPSVTSAAIAAVTERVKIRAGSVVLPLHPTIRVAEEWSFVDNLSNGRVGIALASGWHDRDFVFAPQNYPNRREVMVEQLLDLQRLWRGESITATGGSGNEVELKVYPRPVQEKLPVWITAGGAPDTFARAGELGCNLLTHLLGQSIEQLSEKLDAYRSAWREAGHEGEGRVTLMMHTFVGTDLEEVKARVAGPMREYLRTSVSLISQLAQDRGQDLRSAEFTEEDMEALLDHAFERYFQTSALLGTVESNAPMVDRLKSIGVDEIACLIDFGVPDDDVLANLEHLAELRVHSNPSDDGEREIDLSVAGSIEREDVTHLQCTPSMMRILLADERSRRALASVGTLMLGGEALPATLVAEIREVTDARIINMYGPTETTIWSSTHEIDEEIDGVASIGTPFANTTFHVLDRNREPVPVGVEGELYIGGDGVVPGYLNRPELTAERFVASPFGGDRVYRTGDRVRWQRDGTVAFLGRVDFQVKVRGYRIELGEIESAIMNHPGIREAVAMAEGEGDDVRLVAYVVTEGASVDGAEIRGALESTLPEYMIPTQYVFLPDLPRTPNAKVDRKALPALAATAPETANSDEEPIPEGGIEGTIAEVWKEVLRIPSVGRSANFFDVGGNSLLTVRLHLKLRERLPYPIALTDLFRYPTIAALAEKLGANGSNGAAAPSVDASAAGADRASARRQAVRRRRPTRDVETDARN